MITTQRPQQTTLFGPGTAPFSHRSAVRLSNRQLFNIELGLYLLTELQPTAPPGSLPTLLNSDLSARNTWTARQRRCLDRGRMLLGALCQCSRWTELLDRYARLASPSQAFDISHDRSQFNAKTVGFFRNRAFTFRQMLA
ncbi:hypothetical protein J2I47_24615 [Fibrella sp. HMF5335]|uniref:pPIWI-RE three-gene island domain-containing protein n=1 Tax=Fibrella rubiginis TaxID=2817060 RepID=A0A939GNL3_9BACT|nr:hypothetical protein [Fibrella rubiginis]MBO0939752.1 hypothetical protein [Fibrella rubiginis]